MFSKLNSSSAIITKSFRFISFWLLREASVHTITKKKYFSKIHGKSLAKITSCMECVLMQSRKADNIMVTRRSKAIKCGFHRTGATGSPAIDSLINCDSGFGPFWNLKPSCKHLRMWFAHHSSQPPTLPFSSSSSVPTKYKSGQKRNFTSTMLLMWITESCNIAAMALNWHQWHQNKDVRNLFLVSTPPIKESKHLKIDGVR